MRRLLMSFVMVIVLLLSMPFQSRADDSLNVSVMDELYSYWGRIVDIATFDHYTYVLGENTGLHILDVTDLSNPVVAGFRYYQKVNEVMIHGNLAFISYQEDESRYIDILDISEPETPVRLSSIQFTNYSTQRFYANGNYLYVADYQFTLNDHTSALKVYEISNPSNPEWVFNFPFEGGDINDFLITEDKLYIPYLDYQNRFLLGILDISDPQNIFEISSTRIFASTGIFSLSTIVGNDSTVYFSADDDLWIMDVSDPQNVSSLGRLTVDWDVCDITKIGDNILSINNHQVRVFNVSDPTQPTVDNFFNPEGIYGNYSICDDILYVLEGPNVQDDPLFYRVIAQDISDLMDFQEISIIDHKNSLKDFVSVGDYLYISSYLDHPLIADISDPSNMVDLGYVDIVDGTLFSDSDLLFSFNTDTLVIYNVESPLNPQLLFSSANTYNLEKIIRHENYIIGISDYPDYTLYVFDISSPDEGLSLISSFDSHSTYDDYFFPQDLCLIENYIYMAGTFGDSGQTVEFKIMELEENGDLDEKNNFHFMGVNNGGSLILSTGNHLILADRDIYILEISDPENPSLVYSFGMESLIRDIDFQNNHLCYSTERGFYIYDLSDITNPVETGFYEKSWYQSLNSLLHGDVLFTTGFYQLHSYNIHQALGTKESPVEDILPDQYCISNVYPNPFNPSLNVIISLPEAAELKVSITNILGQEVAVLGEGFFTGGNHNLTFNGSELSSGVYFVHAKVEGKMDQVEKIVLMK